MLFTTVGRPANQPVGSVRGGQRPLLAGKVFILARDGFVRSSRSCAAGTHGARCAMRDWRARTPDSADDAMFRRVFLLRVASTQLMDKSVTRIISRRAFDSCTSHCGPKGTLAKTGSAGTRFSCSPGRARETAGSLTRRQTSAIRNHGFAISPSFPAEWLRVSEPRPAAHDSLRDARAVAVLRADPRGRWDTLV